VTEDPEISRLVLKATSYYEKLDPDEVIRLEASVARRLGPSENVFLRHERNLVGERAWREWEAYHRDQVAPEGFRRFWVARRTRTAPTSRPT